MKEYVIEERLVTKVVSALAQRPFMDVYDLIAELQLLREIEVREEVRGEDDQ